MKEYQQKTALDQTQQQDRKKTRQAQLPNSALLSILSAGAEATPPDAPNRGDSLARLDEQFAARSRRMTGHPQSQLPGPEAEARSLAGGVSGTTPQAVKASMGSSLGADFSPVRFHTDSASASRVDAMGAKAYTAGADVFFGSGGFQPETAAHELVHTAQQGAVSAPGVSLSAPLGGIQMDPGDEDEKRKEGEPPKEEEKGKQEDKKKEEKSQKAEKDSFETTGKSNPPPDDGLLDPDEEELPLATKEKLKLTRAEERRTGGGGQKAPPTTRPRARGVREGMAQLAEQPRPKTVEVPDHRGLHSATDFARVAGTKAGWADLHLPTSKAFEKSTSVALLSRGDALKSISGALDAFHAAADGADTQRMTNRVVIYGALRQLKACCDAYLSTSMKYPKRSSAVRTLSGDVDTALDAISGGQQEVFGFADTTRKLERDSYSGMSEADVNAKNFGTDKNANKRKMDYTAFRDQTARVEMDETIDPGREKYFQANAVMATMRAEEIDDMQEQFKNDPVMSGILGEIKQSQSKVHYTSSIYGPKVTLGRTDEKDARYTQVTRLFSMENYHGQKTSRRSPNVNFQQGFSHNAQMDLIHEATHVVNGETFHGRGRNYAVPVQALGTRDPVEQERVMKEIRLVLKERNQAATAIQQLIGNYLSISPDTTQPAPRYNYSRSALERMYVQAGYTFNDETGGAEKTGTKNRVASSWEGIQADRNLTNQKKGLSDSSVRGGIADMMNDPELFTAYARFGKAAMSDAPSPAAAESKQKGSSMEMFSNALVEYDSTINEMYYYCMAEGVDKTAPQDPLYKALQKAASDALHYRQRFRNTGLFMSNTTAQGIRG